jgi:hypothetical protein
MIVEGIICLVIGIVLYLVTPLFRTPSISRIVRIIAITLMAIGVILIVLGLILGVTLMSLGALSFSS